MQILCTLGPSSMNDRVIARMEELGVSLFRLNLSHISAEQVGSQIEYLQQRTSVPICLDTEGAQIRTGYLIEDEVVLRENSTIRVPGHPVPGDAHSFNLTPDSVLSVFEIGDFITIDSTVLTQVIDRENDGVVLRVLTGGLVGRNKAATLERDIELPPLTAKDRRALEIGKGLGIRYVALSFAHRASDVDEIRAVAAPDATVISKIECLPGLANLEAIAKHSDALLIDRGDLSRQVPIEKIPLVQKKIISVGKAANKPVYVATNLMESMTTQPTPTRAEVNDVFNTILDGADGLVLAGETAVGKYPIGCVSMIKKLVQAFEESADRDPFERVSQPVSLLVEPHGGTLVSQNASGPDLEGIEQLRRIELPRQDLLDCQRIALGTFSPLSGFMNLDSVRSVLDQQRLPDGVAWPVPIVLRIPGAAAEGLEAGQRITLCEESGDVHSLMEVSEIFEFDFGKHAERWFGGDAEADARVARLMRREGVLLAGEIKLIKRLPAPHRQYQLPPADTRYLFAKKGWNRIIAFHTHTLPHRAHEEIQHRALDLTHADGLYLTIETGAVEPGDFLPGFTLRAYQMLIDFGFYPRDRVLLGASAMYSAGAGAREAALLALCRKNMGFSHIVLGRNDSSEGRATRALFESMGDLGIEPVFFETLGYDPEERSLVPQSGTGVLPISGRLVRNALQSGERLPEWFMRSIIQDSARAEIGAGRSVFAD
ncbi:MAG: sulfate adenylyltransferase [bacterium]|nr:sulfate adenylyltransferase [bacterium]